MIQALSYLDTWALSLVLWKNKSLFEAGEGPVRFVALGSHLKLKEWQPLKAVVARGLNALTPVGKERPTLASIGIEKLLPKGHTEWVQDAEFAVDHNRFHLPIITNPGAFFYCGTAMVNMLPGILSYVDVGQWCSAVNNGDHPRYHLIVDIHKAPEVEVKE